MGYSPSCATILGHPRSSSMEKFNALVNGAWNTLRSDKYWKYQRLAAELALEVVIIIVFLKTYNMVRNKFGSQKCTPEFALGHAVQVINAERMMGIFWEQEIQGAVIHWKSWIRMWNIFYGSAHMAVTVFVLGYLFAVKPGAYQRCRTVFIIMNILAISGYAGYPLMPPRLVNACDDPYGGCVKSYKFEDTLHTVGGIWSWKDKGVSKVSNHYAAMPSMHAGYSIWCSASMYGYSPHLIFRMLALLYPLLTLYCIVVTANHFFLDAVFGVAAFWVATKLALYMPRVGRGADEGEEGAGGDAEERQGLLLPITAPGGDQAMQKGEQKSEQPADGSAHVKSIHLTMSTLQKR